MKRYLLPLAVCALFLATFVPVYASFYGGGGVEGGLTEAQSFDTGSPDDPRETIENIFTSVLSYMALAATIAIVAAGIVLTIGGVSDTWRDRAKNIILYAIIGLFIILLASAIVGFVAQFFD